jgi:hypothetical protein
MSYITKKIADSINNKFGTKCTVIALTKNQYSLIPPSRLIISSNKHISNKELEKLVKNILNKNDYVIRLLNQKIIE